MRFVAGFKDIMMSCYKQNWPSEIEGNEKYKWFNVFNDSFVAESYLSFLTTKRFRDTLTRFRVRACCLRSHKVWFLTIISENNSCQCVDICTKKRSTYCCSAQFTYNYVRNMFSQSL